MSDQIIELGEDRTITVDGVRYDQDTGEVLSSEFTIDSPDRARWVAKKIVTWSAQAQALTEQYERDLKSITKERDGFLNHFGPQLMEFCMLEREAAGGKGKVSVGYGEVSFVSRQGYAKVVDTQKAIEYAKEYAPQFVTLVTPEPFDQLDNMGFKKFANNSDDTIPGTEWIPERTDSYLALGGLDVKLKLTDFGRKPEPTEPETSDGV